MPIALTARPIALLLTAVTASLATITACSVDTATSAPGSAAPDGSVTPVGTLPDGGSLPIAESGADSATPPPANIAASATFMTIDTSQYLSAGANGVLSASSNSAGASETFALTDINGGALESGDAVLLASTSGSYLSTTDANGTLAFSAKSAGDSETFLIVLVDADGAVGGAIGTGDRVALQTKSSGKYVSAINGGGGQVLANAPWDRAWETFTLGLVPASAPDAGGVTPDSGASAASAARQKVLAFLAKISGNHTAIGVENKSGGVDDSNQMTSMAGNGQKPSFWSADWGFGGAATPSSREAIVQEGKKQWASGALVQYIYHACPLGWGANEQCDYQNGNDPIKGSFGQLDDAQWSDLTTPGGSLNKVWLARLDAIAPYFQELKDAGIAPLFRPLHEINASSVNNGGWAWWQGKPGSKGSALLYQITHDYLVNTKGLDNIVWVWNLQDHTTLATDVNDYRPGASYYDVAALDIYDTGYTQGNYQAMIAGAAGKPFGVAECQFLPEPSVLTAQPLWAYVVVWPDFFYPPYQTNNTKQVPELFSDPQVLTLSAMPGW